LIEIKYLTVPSWRTKVLAVYEIKLKGVDKIVKQEYTIDVRANPTICPSCKNARGGDYEVLIQIRGAKPAEIASALEGLLEDDERIRNSIIDIIEYKNGVDMLVLDPGAARRLAKELRKKYILTTRVTGEDVGVTGRGRLRRRTVISVRIKGAKIG
jgi:nonsense-mediated mRNA decay protein 3